MSRIDELTIPVYIWILAIISILVELGVMILIANAIYKFLTGGI